MTLENHPRPPMGEAALAAIKDAISEQNGYVTGFLAIATFIDGDGDPAFTVMLDPNQSIPITLGLQKMLELQVDRLADANL